LIRDGSDRPVYRLPVSPDGWRAVRKGLFGVTNDRDGTAYHYAHWRKGQYALCGKTGSATTHPRPIAYRVEYVDATGTTGWQIVPATTRQEAEAEFNRRTSSRTIPHTTPHTSRPDASAPPSIVSAQPSDYWPPPGTEDGEKHSHAWFAGYLQAVDESGQPRLDEVPPIAFALLVEYGGSGGRTAGPIAKELATVIHEMLGDGLDPNARGGT